MSARRLKWISAVIVPAFALTAWLVRAAEPPQRARVTAPDVPDVTIKIRRTFDAPGSTVLTEVLYFKGLWQRSEHTAEFHVTGRSRTDSTSVNVVRCDERRQIFLNDAQRLFFSLDINGPAPRPSIEMPAEPAAGGAPVNITIDAVDTGQRRQMGSRVARHVITTTTTDAAPTANMRSSVVIQDAWFIDAPPANCFDAETMSMQLVAYRPDSVPDRIHVERRGATPRGVLIEGTTRTSGEPTPTEHVTLTEYSESPLDPSLFRIPAGYRQALPLLGGGFDLEKRNTLGNRMRNYWEDLASWAQALRF